MAREEASFDEMHMALSEQQGTSEADKKLLVVFSIRPHHNQVKSAEQGRPIYEDRDYITIMVPGDKDSVIERPATDMDKARFRAQYRAFKDRQNQETVSGTPLRQVSFITASQAKEFEYFNIYTVEQLAGMPDSNAQRIMGAQRLKQLAADFLRAAESAAPLTAMREEMSQKDAQIAALVQSVETLKKQVAELQEAE